MTASKRRTMREAADLLSCLASYPDHHMVGTGTLPGKWSAEARNLALDTAIRYSRYDGWEEWWAGAEAYLRERLERGDCKRR